MWSVGDGQKEEPLSPLKQMPTELEFEQLLVANPEMLEPGLRLIGRQTPTQTGWLDLLAVDTDGRLVVFELKRGMFAREAVTQVLDYASGLDGMSTAELAEHVATPAGFDLVRDVARPAAPASHHLDAGRTAGKPQAFRDLVETACTAAGVDGHRARAGGREGRGPGARPEFPRPHRRSDRGTRRPGAARFEWGRRRRRRTAMTQPAWNRGDGQPDRRRLDEALNRILEHCRPVEVILFGSAARGELQDSSYIDQLVVLADGESAEPERMCFDICEAIGCQPQADVTVAFEKEVREAASAWPAPCTPGPRKDPAIAELRVLTDAWLRVYNQERPHDSLGRVLTVAFLPRPTTAGPVPFGTVPLAGEAYSYRFR